MSRTTKVMGFSVPPAVVNEIETLAKQEHRTKSELFREMVRVYHRYRVQRESDEDGWIRKVIAEARTEQIQEPMSLEEMLAENERLTRYGAKQAKKLGIKPKDIDRIIHEHRRSRRA